MWYVQWMHMHIFYVTDETIDETAYIFDPNYLPQQRQQFYQLCDLHDDSLQAIIHNNDGKETKCHVSTIYM